MAQRLLSIVTALILVAVAVPGCGSVEDPEARDYVVSVATADGMARATYVAADPPRQDGGPIVTVTTNPAVIPGSTTPTTLTAETPFTIVILAIDDGEGGIVGHYRLDLPAPTTSVQLAVTLSQDLVLPSFAWVYAVADHEDALGPWAYVPVDVISVGTGDVQVTLSWNTMADVDLHVVDPNGAEIYYANRVSDSGGTLDLDSNAACGSDGPRNENITWLDEAPYGTYRVAVDYWGSCGAEATDYTVTVNVAGSAPMTFTGTFTGPGDQGGSGAGVAITSFDLGPAARRASPAVTSLGTRDVSPAPGAVLHAKP